MFYLTATAGEKKATTMWCYTSRGGKSRKYSVRPEIFLFSWACSGQVETHQDRQRDRQERNDGEICQTWSSWCFSLVIFHKAWKRFSAVGVLSQGGVSLELEKCPSTLRNIQRFYCFLLVCLNTTKNSWKSCFFLFPLDLVNIGGNIRIRTLDICVYPIWNIHNE